jgi:autotransporter-associated beta strand protein
MKPKSILRFSIIAFASFAASAHAATYNWIGTTSDFDQPSNWVENAWTQWGDYRFGSSAVSGAVNLDAFFGGGNLYLDSGLAYDITLTGSQPLVAYANANNGGLITIDTASKDLTIQTGILSAGAVTWNVGAGRTLTMEGQLSNWFNTASLIKQGSGTAVLKSASGYTGGTTLSGGTLRLENTSALGGGLSMANGTTLQLRSDNNATFNGGNGMGGIGNASITIDVNQLTSGNSNKTLTFATGGFDTYNTTINATGGNGYTLAIGAINNGYGGSLTLNADTANLTIGNIGSSSAVSSLSVSGNADTTITGAINSFGGMAKSGGGTLTLSGSHTYTGATTVSAGTLYVTGALSSSAVTVGADGTIGSNGAAGTLGNGLAINAGGNLDLTGATLALNSTGILSLTGGSLTLGNLTFQDLVGWDWANAAVGTYELIDGTFSINWGSTAYLSAETAYDFGNGKKGYFTSGSLNVVVIPEPQAALLGGLGLLCLLRRKR